MNSQTIENKNEEGYNVIAAATAVVSICFGILNLIPGKGYFGDFIVSFIIGAITAKHKKQTSKITAILVCMPFIVTAVLVLSMGNYAIIACIKAISFVVAIPMYFYYDNKGYKIFGIKDDEQQKETEISSEEHPKNTGDCAL